MKKLFTRTTAFVAVLLISVWGVNAQTFTWDKSELTTAWANTAAASTIKTQGGVSFEQIGTAGVATSYIDLNNSNGSLVLNATSNDALTITSSDPITEIKVTFSANGSTNVTNPYIGFHSSGSAMGSASATVSSCLMDATGVTGTTGVEKSYIPPVGTKFIIIVRGKACDAISANSQTARIYNVKVYTQPAAPSITAFSAAGVNATINQTAKTITAELPYGTNLTAITPNVTIGGTATSYSPTGAQDFSAGAVNYIVTDGTPANDVTYAVTLTASTVASSENDLSAVTIGGYTPVFNSSTNTYSVVLPKGSSLTQAIAFTKPVTATANFTSGNTADLSTPLAVTVTAQDNSTKEYTFTASVGQRNIAYIINTAVDAKDIKIRPMLANGNYIVNIPIANITTTYDFSAYDLVVLTESPSSGSVGMKALWGINKPLLTFKMYAINANTWNLSAGANPSPAATGVTVAQNTHPIFAGITLSGTNSDEIQILSPITSGNGIQTSTYSSSYNLANIIGLSTPGIIEFPVGTTSTQTGTTNAATQAKLMIFSIANDNQDKVTEEGLALIQNTANYLTSSTAWAPLSTGLSGNNISAVSFDGHILRNTAGQEMMVYNATGRLVVRSVQDINMASQPAGVYFVKSNNKTIKIAVVK